MLAGWVLGGSYLRLLSDEERQTVLIYGAGSAGRPSLPDLSVNGVAPLVIVSATATSHGGMLALEDGAPGLVARILLPLAAT